MEVAKKEGELGQVLGETVEIKAEIVPEAPKKSWFGKMLNNIFSFF